MNPDVDRFYRTLAREAPAAIVYADAAGLIAFWNKGAERIFGFSEAEAVGKIPRHNHPGKSPEASLGGLCGDGADRKDTLRYRGCSCGSGIAEGRRAHFDRVHHSPVF